jgi:hypothetical protein
MYKTLLAAGALGAAAVIATAPVGAADTASHTYTADLRGGNEIGGGDPDGSGHATITIANDYSKICYKVDDLKHLGEIKAMHIHFGKAGTNGPPVLPLKQNGDEEWSGCASGAAWTQNRLQGDPQDFYVNVHTVEFPDGAIRGQLAG